MFLFVFQEQLDESQIDASFKSLFRQLAGPVSVFLAGTRVKRHFGSQVTIVQHVFVPTGHGDQYHRAADHPEQDHQQTLVISNVFVHDHVTTMV